MRNADRTITLYNFALEAETGYSVSFRTVIGGVSVHQQLQVSVDSSGMSSADKTTIRIPLEAAEGTYVRPIVYAALEDKTGFWTLAHGDKIVIGLADEQSPTKGEIEKRYGNEYCVTVIGVTDNRDKREPHWKVTCQ